MKITVFILIAVFSLPLLGQYPTGSGPEPAISYSDEGLPSHTIYRPQELKETYPVVLWGNGSCVNSNYNYREFLAEVASHGFIVLAIGPYRDTPAPRLERPEDPAQWPPFETSYRLHFDAMDWLESENKTAGSAFTGHVDISNMAVMGHSCGGLQAVKASSDLRVTTTLVLNSGLMPDDDQYMLRHEARREELQHLHAPIAYFIGGETDIAYGNAEADWVDLQQQDMPAINANMDVGHGATFQLPGGYPFAEGPLAWLNYQLRGDSDAAAMFEGVNCGLCSASDWTLKRHRID